MESNTGLHAENFNQHQVTYPEFEMSPQASVPTNE